MSFMTLFLCIIARVTIAVVKAWYIYLLHHQKSKPRDVRDYVQSILEVVGLVRYFIMEPRGESGPPSPYRVLLLDENLPFFRDLLFIAFSRLVGLNMDHVGMMLISDPATLLSFGFPKDVVGPDSLFRLYDFPNFIKNPGETHKHLLEALGDGSIFNDKFKACYMYSLYMVFYSCPSNLITQLYYTVKLWLYVNIH